jgi:hypothetical protein
MTDRRMPELLELAFRPSGADAELDLAPREVVDGDRLLGQHDRVPVQVPG